MAGAKPRTLPSSARQIYGKVPEKYFAPYFAKVLITGNKTTKYLPKYGGNLHRKRDMCMHHILEKCRNPNFLFLLCTGKRIGCKICSQFMHSDFTGYGLNLEAWWSRHSDASFSRNQAQDGELTEKKWICQKTI